MNVLLPVGKELAQHVVEKLAMAHKGVDEGFELQGEAQVVCIMNNLYDFFIHGEMAGHDQIECIIADDYHFLPANESGPALVRIMPIILWMKVEEFYGTAGKLREICRCIFVTGNVQNNEFLL